MAAGLHHIIAQIHGPETGQHAALRLRHTVGKRRAIRSGDSSLARFCRMPFSELKIHRSLIRDLNESDEARIVVELLIDLSRRLNLKVCAEGVESLSHVEVLRAMGCDRAQGFYFGRPAPIGQISSRSMASAPGMPAGIGFGRDGSGMKVKSR